jgi:pSer/pThr/pTyr-binding forkhead associated (FHA) protein
MIKCQFCQFLHVDNTIFCNECGNYLLDEDNEETDPLETVSWLGETTANDQAGRSLESGTGPLAVRLKIGACREIQVPLIRAILIGRVAPSDDIFPEVNIPDERISRRHARILKTGKKIVIEDAGSINGTFINGERLIPYLPETLNDGDRLQLGTLQLEVKFLNR